MTLDFYQGYIRNRKQLCRELALPEGTEEHAVLEAGYRRWGERLPDHLYGAFAFVFRDPERGSLLCARDPIGLQPFFYRVTEDRRLLYGCGINELLRESGCRAVDREALQRYMNFGYPAGDKTLWQGIRKLMPGQSMTFRDGEARISNYWQPAFAPDFSRTEEDWIREIGETLGRILDEDRENNDFRDAASFLSGGVDSAYLLALSRVPRAIGIGYRGEDVSEAPLAARTAEKLRVDFTEADVTPQAFFSAVPHMVRRMGLPLADASAVVFGIGCEKAAQSCSACFSGEGADEFFAGYRVYRLADSLARTGGPPHFGCAGVMTAEEAAKLLMQDSAYDCRYLVDRIYAETEQDEHLSRLLWIDCALWLEGDILFGTGQSAGACGLRLLLPYADRRMFELSACIPSALKWKDGTGKYILRRAADKVLPAGVAFRPKTGFSVPVRKWMRMEPFRTRTENVLFGARSREFFDQALLRRYWTGFLDGCDDLWQIPYAAFVLLTWADEYNI